MAKTKKSKAAKAKTVDIETLKKQWLEELQNSEAVQN